MKNFLRVKITGVNISKLYKLLKNNDIEMENIVRQDHKNICFNIALTKKHKFFKLLKDTNYKTEILETYGVSKCIDFFKYHFGYIVGAFIFLFLLIFSNFFISNIKVYGNSKIDEKSIIKLLNNKGISVGKLSNINTNKIKEILYNNYEDISLVSVIKKGTSVIINLKEKQSKDNETINKLDIIATCDGVIEEINCIQGTPLLMPGDSFKKGDVLVLGSFKDINNNIVECKAIANITVRKKYTSTIKFENKTKKMVRTGKIVKNTNYNLFGIKIGNKNIKNKFNTFEIEEKSCYIFKNFLLPIKVNYTYYFETKEKVILNKFEKEKVKLETKVKEESKKLVPKTEKIINEYAETVETLYGFDVKYTCETIENL